MSFKNDLATVSARIDAMLRDERFADRVSPGYLRNAVTDYPTRGGKRLRPALVIWFCELSGGTVDPAWYAALAVELYHNWTLVHDDLIDNDELRRGQPTSHASLRDTPGLGLTDGNIEPALTFGRDMALLAGDIQHAWAVDCLCRSTGNGVSADVTLALVTRLCSHVTPALISGEALDVEFALRTEVTAAQNERMMRLKTGTLLEFCAQAGVVLGTRNADWTAPLCEAAGRFARDAGLAFQLQDDVLGLFGSDRTLGKPVGSDLREGKRTLLFNTALQCANAADRDRLLQLWGTVAAAPDDVAQAQTIVRACGALDTVKQKAADLVVSANAALEPFPPGPVRDRLTETADYFINRDR